MISRLRLQGQPCPADLAFLIQKCGDLLGELGISIPTETLWSPWLDKSYLTELELRDPIISANGRAIEEVCDMISFVAETDGGECIGYWRGPHNGPISEAALVYYDTEGMFYLCGRRFVDALFVLRSEYGKIEELRRRLNEGGIHLDYETEDDIPIPAMDSTPEAVHEEKFSRYRPHSESS